ncbi:MAG TPA: DUF1028 domain-containing protein, partial [Planctomycetota bacterium]|nr:DUF1028 domain-containing protein [Planctomycetota bacterium]
MSIRRLLLTLGLLGALAPQALATWSIVVMNRRTGEVGVTSATCIADLDLRVYLPVIVPGKGAAAAQSFIDTQARNRKEIRMMIESGFAPDTILQFLAATDTSHQTRQYGIVTRYGDPITFTGTGAGLARFGVVGSIGEYEYAIQGNVLTGDAVILAAEQAFRSIQGDMAERMMAGMEAAMALGGDGRCSCNDQAPTSCGVPPPSFTHSAYTGFFLIGRLGDDPGGCESATGCATGDYYANLNFIGNATTLDPVVELRNQFDAWRTGLAGVPDQVRSQVFLDRSAVVAGGVDRATLMVELRDLADVPVTSGVATLEVESGGFQEVASIGSVIPLGGGVYQLELTANTRAGSEDFAVTAVLHGGERIRLAPDQTLVSRPAGELTLDSGTYSSGAGTLLGLNLRRGASQAGAPYRILASTSGTQPGSTYAGISVPLNADGLWSYTQSLTGAAPFRDCVYD